MRKPWGVVDRPAPQGIPELRRHNRVERLWRRLVRTLPPVQSCERLRVRTSPWHSIKQPVHHDNTDCNAGNNIERENLRTGTGGKPRCAECARLDGSR